MATGDVVAFDQAKVDLGNKIHDLDTDTWKVGLITSAATPSASTAAPHWGGTGTTNFATSQVTPGGNYTTGGPTLATLSYSNSGGTVSWQAAKVAIAIDVANPTNARWGIVYNDTDANKRAVAYVDLGAELDMTAGPLEIRWGGIDGVGTILTVA